MIEAVDLKKSFGSVQAVRGISFEVKRGEAVGFLGPNGAGKTTTFRMLAGTIGPTEGTVRLAGHDLAEDPILAKRALGYMAENAPLYAELTGHEYLLYRAELKGIESRRRKKSALLAADEARVTPMLGTKIAHLSKGYRQRLALADALLGDPPIVLLDEPTSGLDPNQVLDVRDLIRRLSEKRAVVLSTHVLSEVEATCSRAIVIHEGRIAGSGTLSELRNKRAKRATLTLRASEQSALEAVEAISSGPPEVAPLGEGLVKLTLSLDQYDALPRAVAACVTAGLEVLEAAPERAALDEVFARLTTRPKEETP